MEFTFYYVEPNTKTVIAIALLLQLQELSTAKVIYLTEDSKKK